MIPVPLPAVEGEELLSCSAFSTRLSGCYEGSQGYAYGGKEVQGRPVVHPALHSLAVHLNSHKAVHLALLGSLPPLVSDGQHCICCPQSYTKARRQMETK